MFFATQGSSPGSGRLSKRSLPQFVPPLLSAKKRRFENDNGGTSSSQLGRDNVGVAGELRDTSELALGKGAEEEQLEKEYTQLSKTLEERKEKLRKLKLVQLYRSKVERLMLSHGTEWVTF